MMVGKRRKSLRLPHYNYAMAGAYFVTICVQDRICLLGDVAAGAMVLSPAGQLVQETWQDLPRHYPHIALDEFVVMPNHVHGLLIVESGGGPPLTETVRAFKSFSAREINKTRPEREKFAWQRGFHEHVVRDGKDLTA